MDHIKKLQAKMEKGRKLSDHEKNAKMSVLQDLKKMAQDAMSENLPGMHKVTVAADSPEGLEHGLEKAHDIAEHMPEMEHEMSGLAEHADESEGEMPEEHDMDDADREHEMHDTYEDDAEDSDAHPDAIAEEAEHEHETPMGELHDDEDDMDEHELNRRLEKLMAIKKRKGLA